MEIKYLSNGRKVAVVGQLNNVETIVQEIFITEKGDEIPSGERFVVKSLHDAPVISYKMKEEKELEERVLKIKTEIKNLKKKEEEAAGMLKARTEILKTTDKLISHLPESEIEAFAMFMTGTIEYLVVDGYGITEPVKMIDKIIQWDNYWGEKRYDGIKLLSILGKSEGKLEYRINQYSDGSGGSYTECYPFTNYEAAIEHIKNRAIEQIEKDRLDLEDYRKCLEMGISFNEEHTNKVKAFMENKQKKSIENIQRDQDKLDERLKKAEDMLKDFK